MLKYTTYCFVIDLLFWLSRKVTLTFAPVTRYIFKRLILLIPVVVSHFHAVKICFTCDCAVQDRIIRFKINHIGLI